MKAWAGAALPRPARQIGAWIGAWIEKQFGRVDESRAGLIALLQRLGLECRKPDAIPRKRNDESQNGFIESYDKRLNALADNEAVPFADAGRPPSAIACHDRFAHAARPVGCWAPRQAKRAIAQPSGRRRIDIYRAIDL